MEIREDVDVVVDENERQPGSRQVNTSIVLDCRVVMAGGEVTAR